MDRQDDATSAETVAFVRHAAAPRSRTDSAVRTSSSSRAEEGRFVPGTLLGGRYRIIALLGRGGMGEVYRATDLTLGQSVALKFLPEEAAGNQRLLERFHGEVRVARQVLHPNVCRVYDIGEAEGMPFISMEYVDGEDLASLLTRIGRLPVDKALETARKLCAGLAAAHDRGIVHRDLKPQNVMIDRRGEALIMDFGLAAIAGELTGAEVRNGTPAYMAPEQLKGSEVTARSDIYALGLVLYELFTGRRPFDARDVRRLLQQQESAQLTSMSSIAADIDPAVERVIRRCLDPDPAKRPPSALAVAAALPGGDPLAAALAAGETPSPEVVASAGEKQGLARKYSVSCTVAIVVCLFAGIGIRNRDDAMMHAPLDYSPDMLALKAREFAAGFGYTKKPADSQIALSHRGALLRHLRGLPKPRHWRAWLAAESPIAATYRESLSPLVAPPTGDVSETNPPPISPGMISVRLDGAARLREFSAVPYGVGEEAQNPVQPETVFRDAGLDISKFTETKPGALPDVPADQLRAWKGPHPAIPGTELNVEIASWKGRVTYAKIEFPWETAPAAQSAGVSFSDIYTLAVITLALLFAALFAQRNWKLGRIDRKGALRIAMASFFLDMAAWIGSVHAVPTGDMYDLLRRSMAEALFSAAIVWVVYLALEPAVRARWPHSIVTWNRIVAGRWLDPLVASHVLIGGLAGSVIWIAMKTIARFVGARDVLGEGGALFFTMGARQWFAGLAFVGGHALTIGLVGFFAIFGLRTLLRKDVFAAIAASIVFTFLDGNVVNSSQWPVMAALYVCLYAAMVFLLLRFGLVATLAAVCFINGFNGLMVGPDWSAWFAPFGIAMLLFMLAATLVAFWCSLGPGGLLGDAGAEDA